MTKQRDLPPFDALPARAKRDLRLQAAHYAVLLAIASHDRFSLYNGSQACWASINTIAGETGRHRVTVVRAINDLIAWGYLTSHRKSQNVRHIAIVYSEPTGSAQATTKPAANGKGCVSTGYHGGSVQATRVVARQNAKSKPRKANSAPSITFKQNLKSNSAEATRRPQKDGARSPLSGLSDGAFLRRLEALIPNYQNGPLSHGKIETVKAFYVRCGEIWETYELGDPLNGWARRLEELLFDILRNNHAIES